jgi:hypothetical protein
VAVAALSSTSSSTVLAAWYERPALRIAVAATLALAVAHVAAGRLWSRRRFKTVANVRRGALILVAAFAVLSCLVALVLRAASRPERVEPAVQLAALTASMPTTRQGFFACVWVAGTDWEPLVAARSYAAARRHVGSYLAGTDDPAIRMIGKAYLGISGTSDSATTDSATVKNAATALLRLCDVERRYGRPDKANPVE